MRNSIATVLLAISLLSVTSACNGQSETLTVFNWDSYFGSGVKAAFESRSGIHVREKNYASNEELEQLLKGERADVVFPSTFMAQRLQAMGQLGRVDWSKLANGQFVPPEFQSRPEARSCVPYTWSGVALFVDRQHAEGNVGLEAIFDPSKRRAYSGHIMMLDDRRALLGLALRHLGYSVNSVDEGELDRAVDLIRSAKRDTLMFANGLLTDKIANTPAAWIGLSWSGDARFAKEKRPGIDVSIPDKSIAYVDWACVTKTGGPAAISFLDHLLDPQQAADLAVTTRFAPVNSKVLDFVKADDVKSIILEFLKRATELPAEMVNYLGDEGERKYERAWLKVKQ